ncbi:hypothetical protein TcCL_NonESM12906, partial [Trypanosoma cruzi]
LALYALELSFRDSSLVLAPGPGGVLNALLRHLVPAARCSLRTMSGTSLADGSLRSSWKRGTLLASADTGRTHAARRVVGPPAALCPARGERGTGPPPPVSAAGTPPTSTSINATTHGLRRGDACP